MSDTEVIRIQSIKIGDKKKFSQIALLQAHLVYQSLMTQISLRLSTKPNDELKELIQRYLKESPQSLEELRKRIKEINIVLKLDSTNPTGTVRLRPTGGTGYRYTITEKEMDDITAQIYPENPINPFLLFFSKPTNKGSSATENTAIPDPFQLQQISNTPFANFAIAKHLLHPLFDKTVKEAKQFIESKRNKANYRECRKFLEKQGLTSVEEALQKIIKQDDSARVDTNSLATTLMDIFIQDTVDFLKTKKVIEVEQTDTGLNPKEYSQKLNSYIGEDRTEVKKLVELMASYFVAHESVFEKSLPKPEPEPEPDVKEEPKPEVKEEPKPEVKEEPKPEVKEEQKPEVKEEQKPEVKEEQKPEVKEEQKPEVKEEQKPEVKEEQKPEVKEEPEPSPEPKPEGQPVMVYLPETPPREQSCTVLLPETNSKDGEEPLTTREQNLTQKQEKAVHIKVLTEKGEVVPYSSLPFIPILLAWCFAIPGLTFVISPIQILLGLLANKKVQGYFTEEHPSEKICLLDENGEETSVNSVLRDYKNGLLLSDNIFLGDERLSNFIGEKEKFIKEYLQKLPQELSELLKEALQQIQEEQRLNNTQTQEEQRLNNTQTQEKQISNAQKTNLQKRTDKSRLVNAGRVL